MPTPISFYYDFISPYSYFAFVQREELRGRSGRELDFLPVPVGKIMEQVGNVPTSITCAAKRAYLGQDLGRWASRLNVPLRPHPKFGTFSTAPLIKAALKARSDVEAFSAAAFAAMWIEAAPVDDDAAMGAWFAQKDERFARYWEAREEMAEALETRVAAAVADGAFGVPHFHTDKGDFFGNDRIEFLVEAFAA